MSRSAFPVLAVLGILLAAFTGAANARDYRFEGSWAWSAHNPKERRATNHSVLIFHGGTLATYCYNADCRKVRVKQGPGRVVGFKTSAGNYFQFWRGRDGTLSGHFWHQAAGKGNEPDARLRMQPR